MWFSAEYFDPPESPSYDSAPGQLFDVVGDDEEWAEAKRRDVQAEAVQSIAAIKARIASRSRNTDGSQNTDHIDANEQRSRLTPIEFSNTVIEKEILGKLRKLTDKKLKAIEQSQDPLSFNPNVEDLKAFLEPAPGTDSSQLEDAFYSHAVIYGVGETELIEMYKQALAEISYEKFDASDIDLSFDFINRLEIGKNRHPFIVEHSTQIDYNNKLIITAKLQKFDKAMIELWESMVGSNVAKSNRSRAVTRLEIPTDAQRRVERTMMKNAVLQSTGQSQVIADEVISTHIGFVKSRLEEISPPALGLVLDQAVNSAVEKMNAN